MTVLRDIPIGSKFKLVQKKWHSPIFENWIFTFAGLHENPFYAVASHRDLNYLFTSGCEVEVQP